MKHLLKLLPWKKCFYLSALILPMVMVFGFYGLYTNKFYFLKVDNYIFSFLILVHLVFLYTLWKVDGDENAYLSP